MRRLKENTRQHIIYGLVLLIAVSALLYLGNEQVKVMKDDYTSRIAQLNQEFDAAKSDSARELEDKQRQLDALSSDVDSLDKELADTINGYDSELRKLSDKDKQFGSDIQQLEYTSDLYKLQIGELGQQITDIAVTSDSFSIVIPDVIDSVVSIVTDTGQGSGAIISSEGLVVTNYHVIRGATRASLMTYDGSSYRVGLVGYDLRNDIAVLNISTGETFQHFDFADSDTLRTGQKVVALGNPVGLSFTATEGIISSPSRLANDGLYYIQTDVTLNPGNSGGPLINSRGEIVGIVDFKVAGYEGLGFAIPANRVEDVVSNILAR
ncbi:MAG: trypsin-like peptidase domain-containing protein [archaeon]